jgi:RHS repeat-associated protein
VTNFEYNANGSQTAVTSNVGKPEEQRVPYFYDFEQKLTRIGDTSDAIQRAYAYDADGNRIAESNTTGSGTDIRNYLADPNNSNTQIVEEYNNSNTLLAHYDWNDAELLREATRNADESTFTIREPLADGHNSTRQLLDSTGAISDVYAFDAWGNQQVNTGGSFNPYRYNSQRLDVSGLYNLRARQYSSGIGRFLTHDPLMGDLRNPITQHRYLYAGDDAVNFIDPNGENLAEIATVIGIGATLLATVNTAWQNIPQMHSQQLTEANKNVSAEYTRFSEALLLIESVNPPPPELQTIKASMQAGNFYISRWPWDSNSRQRGLTYANWRSTPTLLPWTRGHIFLNPYLFTWKPDTFQGRAIPPQMNEDNNWGKLLLLAGTIVHEAHHAMMGIAGPKSEPACYAAEINFVEQVYDGILPSESWKKDWIKNNYVSGYLDSAGSDYPEVRDNLQGRFGG